MVLSSNSVQFRFEGTLSSKFLARICSRCPRGDFGWFVYRFSLRFLLVSENLEVLYPKLFVIASNWVQSDSICVQVGLHVGAIASTDRPVRMHALWRRGGRRGF